MINIFEYVDKFFASLQDYNINYNICFISFVGLFLVTIFGVIIATSNSYESKLTKAVDMLNNYFLQNPSINEENLVAFNNKLKSNKIPKQLRKNWQQYVLYREGKASDYMSFDNCVTKPIQNSSFERCINIMNVLAWIFSILSLLVNFYVSYETDIVTVLSKVVVTPAIILLLNFIVTMFLNFRHNAIKSDLFQNYQYFEVNIDKATKTLPDYVDYEVLFDRNEIKRGIPILYTYLQKRAEDEQRELELARLKNVEHEKFNFEDAGVAGSLVLERAMQEAENYIAERKKYNQDTEQINTDITQEDLNFREITKEYNRQMQVSKETFANFKAQLDDASSSIEANYIKKQQQNELDRQRNLERDYDTATERHKKVIESLQAELDSVDKFRTQSRKSLEAAMMSEFDTYTTKVYDEAKKVVDEREKAKYEKVKKQIKELEEKLVAKNQELEEVYYQNQVLGEKLEKAKIPIPVPQYRPEQVQSQPMQEISQSETEYYNQEELEEENIQPEENLNENLDENNIDNSEQDTQQGYQPLVYEEPDQPDYMQEEVNEFNTQEESQEESVQQGYKPLEYEESELPDYMSDDTSFETDGQNTENNFEEFEEFNDFEEIEQPNNGEIEAISEEGNIEDSKESDDMFEEFDDFDFDENPEITNNNLSAKDQNDEDEEENPNTESGEEGFDGEGFDFDELSDEEFDEFEEDEEFEEEPITDIVKPIISTSQNESEQSGVTKRKAGRPRKILSEEELNKPKRKPGRPRKEVSEEELNKPKRKPGRPRKEKSEDVKKKGPGRPRKEVSEEELNKPKRKPGRPKKNKSVSIKKRPGRPKKLDNDANDEKVRTVNKKNAGSTSQDKFKNLDDIDAYLKEIDDVIAQENAKFEASKKELEARTNIKKKK